jgi:hypothetical protein
MVGVALGIMSRTVPATAASSTPLRHHPSPRPTFTISATPTPVAATPPPAPVASATPAPAPPPPLPVAAPAAAAPTVAAAPTDLGQTLIQPDATGSTSAVTITAGGSLSHPTTLTATGAPASRDGLLLLAAGFALPGLVIMTLLATVLTRR